MSSLPLTQLANFTQHNNNARRLPFETTPRANGRPREAREGTSCLECGVFQRHPSRASSVDRGLALLFLSLHPGLPDVARLRVNSPFWLCRNF